MKAAEQGMNTAGAQVALAEMYDLGQGVVNSDVQAYKMGLASTG